MSKWIAFVVVTTTAASPILSWPDDDETKKYPSVGVDVTDSEDSDARFSMQMERSPRVYRMTGVETNATINMPATAVIEFTSEELCLAAATTLRLQPGILSVSCVQVDS